MGRLTGTDQEYIAVNLQKPIKQLARKDRLWFDFGDSSVGEKAHGILKRGYNAEYKEAGDNANWYDFNIKFTSRQAAEFVKEDIEDSITAYFTVHPNEGNPAVGGGGEVSGSDDNDEDEKKSGNLTTYIVLGAAAAIIIALLIPWKK